MAAGQTGAPCDWCGVMVLLGTQRVPRDWTSSPGCMRLYVVMLSPCLVQFLLFEQWTGSLTVMIPPSLSLYYAPETLPECIAHVTLTPPPYLDST